MPGGGGGGISSLSLCVPPVSHLGSGSGGRREDRAINTVCTVHTCVCIYIMYSTVCSTYILTYILYVYCTSKPYNTVEYAQDT